MRQNQSSYLLLSISMYVVFLAKKISHAPVLSIAKLSTGAELTEIQFIQNYLLLLLLPLGGSRSGFLKVRHIKSQQVENGCILNRIRRRYF